MIRIMILDDDEMYLKKEKDITEQYFAEKNVDCTVTIYQNVEWFLLGLNEEKFDMYILDIRMPGENGIEAAREIRRLYPDPVIIFITNFVDYAIEAYEVNTYRYIPKECLKEKLPQAYDALLPGIMEKEERYYIINKRNEVEKLAYSDIFYMKKEGKYVIKVICIYIIGLIAGIIYDIFFVKKKEMVLRRILYIGMIFWLTAQYWAGYQSLLMIILGSGIIVLYVFCYFDCTFKQAYVWNFFYAVNIGLIKEAYVVYAGVFNHKQWDDFYSYPRGHTYQEVIFWILGCLFIFWIIKFILSVNSIKGILRTRLKELFIIGLLEYVLLIVSIIYKFGTIKKENFVMTACLLVVSNIALIGVYVKFQKKTLEMRNQILDMRCKLMEEEYEELRMSYDRYRCLVHDEKHLLLYIKECLENGELDSCITFLNHYKRESIRYSGVAWTGIPEINFMLNIKVRKMEEKNIFFKVDSKIEKIPMKDIDFVVLLGNLLDNAIEAAEKCEEGKGKITCIFRNINDMFIFKVKNTSIYKPYEKNTKFYTSKKEKDEHGWGIESVKQIVRKYNGEIDFKYDKDFFEVEIIISDNT